MLVEKESGSETLPFMQSTGSQLGTKTATIFDPKTDLNASINSAFGNNTHSHHPMEHQYARVLDLQLNARLKSRASTRIENNEQGSVDLEAIN